MLPSVKEAAEVVIQLQSTFAVLFGMFLQFLFGDSKTWRVFVLIAVSSAFIAIYFVPLVLEQLNDRKIVSVAPDSKTAIAMYAFSSLFSIEILAGLIKIVEAFSETSGAKLRKFLGVPPNDKSVK